MTSFFLIFADVSNNELASLLERHGIRPTANRVVIAGALAAAGRPVSMGELETELDTIDKSNISRALAAFRAAHMVHVIEDGSDSVRYELCLSDHEHHDSDVHVHFYCERCGKTFCLSDIPIPSVTLPDGWDAQTSNYIVKGICPDCR